MTVLLLVEYSGYFLDEKVYFTYFLARPMSRIISSYQWIFFFGERKLGKVREEKYFFFSKQWLEKGIY